MVLTSKGQLYVCGTHFLGLLRIDNKKYLKLITLDHEVIYQVQCAEFHNLCLRFSLSQKLKYITNRDLNKKINYYLKRDNCVDFFKLQDETDALYFSQNGVGSIYTEINNPI